MKNSTIDKNTSGVIRNIHIKNRLISGILFLMGVLGVMSCTDNTVYEKNVHISNNTWHKDSSAVFEPQIKDSIAYYNIYLNIRNTADYSFRNIFLFMNTIYPDRQMERDTLEIILAKKDGEWLGSGYGKLRDSKILLRHGIRFPHKGEYTFIIEQAMRKEELNGIADIGIRITKQQ